MYIYIVSTNVGMLLVGDTLYAHSLWFSIKCGPLDITTVTNSSDQKYI